MLTRRSLIAAPLALAAQTSGLELCIHQTTLLGAGFRRSLEAIAKAGIKLVEVIPAHVEEFFKKDGLPAARRLLADLGLRAVSSGSVRGLFEPHPGRDKAIEQFKAYLPLAAELGVDRLVCPCGSAERHTLDDYKRGVDNARQLGDIVKQYRVVAMLEFMRGSTFIGTLPSALDLTRQAAHTNVKPMLDFYHFWAGLSKLEDLELIRNGELHHVHFQDVPRMPRELLDNSTRDIPGDGVAPLHHMLKALPRKAYRGPLSVELFYPRLQNGDPYAVCIEIRRKSETVMRAAGVL
ncbi:MAG: sugar phosphate isomerase/epimerase [Acidimicrobiia bacterium]|nr:sugar phosphate isomerase/epimerase [Acidimicrobiia bacterium]